MFKKNLKNKSLKYISFLLASAIFCFFLNYLLNFYSNFLNHFNLIFCAQLVLAQFFGPVSLGLWSMLNLISYDLLTNSFGIWSYFTGISYFLMSLATSYFVNFNKFELLKYRNYNFINYLVFTALITLLYDLITASAGPLFFNQAWLTMLVGQVPFTLIHVIQNCATTSLIYGGTLLRKNSHKKFLFWLWSSFAKLGSAHVA